MTRPQELSSRGSTATAGDVPSDLPAGAAAASYQDPVLGLSLGRRGRPRSASVRYGAAVGFVAAAAVLRLVLEPVLGNRAPFLPMTLAVTVTAAFSGLRPGLLATARFSAPAAS